MALRWTWPAGIDARLREALQRAFTPEAVQPVAGGGRRVAARGWGVLPAAEALPFDVFVKVFDHGLVVDRLRHLWGRSGAAREFANAVRLHAMGLPVPQPLALVSECGAWGCRRACCLMERLAGARPLDEYLREAADPASARFAAVAREVGRLLADLAARGVWHRDTSPANLLVADAPASPAAGAAGGESAPKVYLVDARHVHFGAGPDLTALESMLAVLGGFLLSGGIEQRLVAALTDEAVRAAAARADALAGADRGAVLKVAGRLAAALVARDIRKGRRAPEGLDVFAQRYATAGDAAGYRDRRFGRSRHGRKVDAAERRLVARLVADLGVGGLVLDVPCGAGRFLPVLADGGREVVGADVSAEMLALARQAAPGGPGAPVPVMADARRLPFADGRFELVFSMRLLHRIREADERVAVLRELARVGRRWVLFSFYNRRSWRALRERLRGRYSGETRGTIAAEAARADLAVERFLPVGPGARQTLVLCTAAARGPAAGADSA